MSLGGRITNSCPVSENFEKIKLRRVGVLSDKPFDGYVAVRMERGAILPILCISLFTLLVTEHVRFLFPRVRKIIGKGPKLIVLVAVWSTGYYYTAVRSTNWLFMYINENWLDLVATQIYLTFTDIVCNACLFFSGCFEFSSFIESESNAKRAQFRALFQVHTARVSWYKAISNSCFTTWVLAIAPSLMTTGAISGCLWMMLWPFTYSCEMIYGEIVVKKCF